MTKNKQTKKKGLIPVVLVVLVLAGVGVITAIAGFALAATKESHDDFCASCHTEPESTFYQRSVAAAPVDLASFHTPKKTHCIDCHSGAGLFGRVQAELLGARNALKFYSGTAIQPAKLTFRIGDSNCTKCHSILTISSGGGDEGGQNHWHKFLLRWQLVDSKAGRCASCHSGHATDGSVDIQYLNEQHTTAVCEACHAKIRGGD
jgi:hypothetical protein